MLTSRGPHAIMVWQVGGETLETAARAESTVTSAGSPEAALALALKVAKKLALMTSRASDFRDAAESLSQAAALAIAETHEVAV